MRKIFRAYGQWPWPRYRLAGLVERLHQQGAQVVALDFLMPRARPHLPEVIISERQRDREVTANLLSKAATDSNSQQLTEAMAKGKPFSVISSILPVSVIRPLMPRLPFPPA